jgi:hypothetical protein
LVRSLLRAFREPEVNGVFTLAFMLGCVDGLSLV